MVIVLAGLATGFAQGPATVLDGVYTATQAARGEAAYASYVLNRQNTVERLNVMSLESVASTCGG